MKSNKTLYLIPVMFSHHLDTFGRFAMEGDRGG